jgi:ABC-2 type transport system ATP-binding protein
MINQEKTPSERASGGEVPAGADTHLHEAKGNLPNVDQADIVIRTRDLTKQFNGTLAVDHVSMDIPRGAIFGFIGPSGCGKTTTLRLLLGVYEPTEGEAVVLGKTPEEFGRKQRERIGYMPQLFVLYPDLTIWENLNFTASLYGYPFRRHARLQELLELVELRGHEGKLARNISGGMQQRLSLAAALVHDPELIFLDEPTAGIDPVLRRKFWDHFHALKEAGHTLFVTTQYVSEAAYCDYVGVMANGRLLMIETPTELRRRALGGDVLQISPARPLSRQQLDALRSQPFVKERKVTLLPDLSLHVVVDDAGTAMPSLLGWLSEQDIEIERASEYNPPFDDVFVMLVQDEVGDTPAEEEMVNANE